jgi:Flp pilus assembly protein TadG
MRHIAASLREKEHQRERGASLVLFTLLIVFLVVPVLGLAIDGSIVMWEKARLVTSVDAAALAAGRSLSVGLTYTDQYNSASQVADTYFKANFQPGHMGTTEVNPNLDGKQQFTLLNSSGYLKVTVARSVSVPLYFLRILGWTNTNLEFTGQASRRDVNIILILDRSASLGPSPIGSNSCATLIASAQNFTNLFVNNRDTLSLVTFQTTANVDFAPSQNFKPAMTNTIGQLKCSGYTNTAMAFDAAHKLLAQVNAVTALNVIVFFSDGKPDAITATFPVKNYADYRYNVSPTTSQGSIGASSTCNFNSTTGNNDPITGILVALDENPDASGSTLGVIDPTKTQPISSTDSTYGLIPPQSQLVNAPNCSFYTTTANTSNYTGGAFNVRQDIGYINQSTPNLDAYGNRMNAWYRPITGQTNANLLFTSTNQYANQIGKIRPDTPMGIVNTALNTAMDGALQIRNDTTYKPVIYSIGLGNYVDDDFMESVANDSRGSQYNSSKPTGLYIKAPTASQLGSAFQQIASQVLKISQ